MLDLKEYATNRMKKQNSDRTIKEEWKQDPSFLPGQIDDVDENAQIGERKNQ